MAAAIVGILLLVAGPALAAPLRLPEDVGVLVWVVTLVVVSVPLLVLQEFRRNVIRRETADERERQRRNDAYRISYRILEWSLVLVPLGLIFRDQIAAFLGGDWFLVWILSYSYAIFLPYMVLAWREPDAAE